MRHKAPIRGATFLPSNPFPPGSALRSCVICRAAAFLHRHFGIAVATVRSLKNGDEHRWNVLQEILGLSVLENFGVLLQLIGHLIDDESPAGRERIVRLLE